MKLVMLAKENEIIIQNQVHYITYKKKLTFFWTVRAQLAGAVKYTDCWTPPASALAISQNNLMVRLQLS